MERDATRELAATARERALVGRISELRHDLAGLLLLWQERHDPAMGWVDRPGVNALLARAFIEVGAPLLGQEVAGEGLEHFPEDAVLRQLLGLAMARGGNAADANRLLEALRSEGHLEDETLGVLARTHKDLGLAADGELRRQHLESALRLYGEAFARSGSYWTGVNVATLAALVGEQAQSAAASRQVAEACRAALGSLPEDSAERYWAWASLGEAALSAGRVAEAEDAYRRAFELGRQRFGDLNSTRRHARLLLAHLGRDPRDADAWLPMPRVVLFSGHMIDRPDRATLRFPPALEAPVARALRGWLRAHNGLIGFSSAAHGADLLFLEAIASLGGESHVVLPYDHEEFAAVSVEPPGVTGWRHRFDEQLAHARVVYASASQPRDEALGYDYANRLVHGLGKLRALELETELLALAVWDGRPGDGLGGTASAVAQWQAHGIPVHRVVLEAGGETVRPIDTGGGHAFEPEPGGVDRVMALLFADAVGFSRLNDAEVELFVEHCLGLVARLLARHGAAAPVRETWGDGLFIAFDDLRAAGGFALELLDAMNATDWPALGFRRPLGMRLALHAGPVRLATDPITGLPKVCGTHVSRAARLEPKTPPGQVYASEAFAALAAKEGVGEFRCDYVKQLEWAKRYGTFPAYVLRRRNVGD